ncbi:MAG: OmpA family protein [Bacteroidetes bacterium]|nr:OmpA family protein [Bacteroidota bacterium]
MRKIFILVVCSGMVFTSCVSKKKYTELQAQYQETKDLLNTCTVKLNDCERERSVSTTRVKDLEDRLADLRQTNTDLIQSSRELTMLTSKGATNLEKSLESLREKDLKISRLQDALNKKDSVTLALVTSLKKEIGINDPDIEVNVEKAVVYISLSDKVLFQTGKYELIGRADEILGKVATVINSKPNFEAMVEGHTDNVPYRGTGIIQDNWDLSVKRATSVVRALNKLGVSADRLVAAGRGEFDPLVPNTTPENRAKNRRTRILILPKIDQFYEMIEKEMKELSAQGN